MHLGFHMTATFQTGTVEATSLDSGYDAARLTDAQKQLVGGFVRKMKILIFGGIWCGDCVESMPADSTDRSSQYQEN